MIKTFIDWREIYAPHLRRTRPTAIFHSGGKKTVFDCICGATHSTSTDWNGRNAKHVINWRDKHDNECDPLPAAIEIENKRQLVYNLD